MTVVGQVTVNTRKYACTALKELAKMFKDFPPARKEVKRKFHIESRRERYFKISKSPKTRNIAAMEVTP